MDARMKKSDSTKSLTGRRKEELYSDGTASAASVRWRPLRDIQNR